ncbi:MAG: relaxase/mobilization nuclease domain-containing protein, partial [Alphaproteobacteria bacterium]
MIIRIQKSGGSFTGAGKYYLHDKAADKTLDSHLKPKTDERVWFADTRNCFAQEPERAFLEMWRVAEDQQWLKRQVGGRTCGRVCENPVKTLSLSWHKEDAPTPEHMIEAADAYLKHMGWDAHQAVFIGHNDTEHRHIHIVLNRVHPENGRTIDDYREKVRSQSWALEYEREHGHIRCEERENNARARDEQLMERHRQRAAEGENVIPFTKQPRSHENAAENTPSPDDKERTKPANDHLPHNV